MATTKTKITAGIAAVMLLLVVGVATIRPRTADHASVRLSADLADDYKLSERDNIRLLRPPFPSKRAQLIKTYDSSGMFENTESWDCLFNWDDSAKESELRWRAGTRQHSDRERHSWIASNLLGLNWYNLGTHDTLPLPAGDWIVRVDFDFQQKLAGFARVLSQVHGRTVSFDRQPHLRRVAADFSFRYEHAGQEVTYEVALTAMRFFAAVQRLHWCEKKRNSSSKHV